MPTTYFIAASGSDTTGTGSSGAPWATFTHAIANSAALDTLAGNGGDTINDNIVLTVATGARNFTSYGTGQCTVAGGSSAGTFLSTDLSIITRSIACGSCLMMARLITGA